MNKNDFLKRVKYWVLPEGAYRLLAALLLTFWRTVTLKAVEDRRILLKNRRLKDLHKGERGFILGCGPSIKEQNIKLLQGETCISVANFFIHPDFNLIMPRYHCAAPWHPPIPKDNYVRLLKAMEPFMRDTNVFLGNADRRIIEQNNLFCRDRTFYMDFNDNRSWLFNRKLDLSLPVPTTISVSIMALMLAIYLGFKEIFLLGFEHTTFKLDGTYEYRHFYEDRDVCFLADIEPPDLEIEFWALETIWKHYKVLRSIATARDIKIFNATRGGLLDLFPRVKYETLFK